MALPFYRSDLARNFLWFNMLTHNAVEDTVQERRLRYWTDAVSVAQLFHISCVSKDKIIDYCEPQNPHCFNGNIKFNNTS